MLGGEGKKLLHNEDHIGFYRVGHLKFYSKLEAIEHMKKTGIHLHWDFNEAVFNSYDWTKEPTTSLMELYRQRAQQLRDQYDYIVLCYSGGADSENALYSFIKNDIKIDEVVSMVNYDATGDKDSWLNEEIFKTAVPNATELQSTEQKFKYRVVDLTQLQLDYFNNQENKFDWIYKMTASWSPNNISREKWVSTIKEWNDIVNSGKKLCILYGLDKPRLWHLDDKFSVRFLDMIDVAAPGTSITDQPGHTNELFYWTPDKPEIIIKQAHIVKRYLSGDVTTTPGVSKIKSDIAFREVNGVKYWITSDQLHSLIYPFWTPGKIVCGKSPSAIFSSRDKWFFNLQPEHSVRKNWAFGLTHLWKILPDYWKNDPTNLSKGIKGCWSKDYYLD
jgi:hypothetical protein